MDNEMETIQDLSKRIDTLLSSIEKEDLKDQFFIAHKYMLLSLYVHTERRKIEELLQTKQEELATKKIHNIYVSIENLLNLKSNAQSEELYVQLIQSQNLVRNLI
jgi:hypothetical protein